MRKKIRTTRYKFSSLLALQNGQSTHCPLESNLNINKNRSTSYVGGFLEICAPTGISSERRPSLKSAENTVQNDQVLKNLIEIRGIVKKISIYS